MLKETSHLVLRPYESYEWPTLSHWFYSGEYKEFFRDQPFAMNEEACKSYANLPNGFSITIRTNKDFENIKCGTMVGLAVLYDIRTVCSSAKFAILIDYDFQSRGLCAETMWSVMDYAFNHLRLEKLVIEILARNERLTKILKSNGFRREALLKKEAYLNNQFEDVLRFCIFQNQGKKLLEKNKEELCHCQQ